MQPIVSLAFIAVYCGILWRWSSDVRSRLGPRLESYFVARSRRRHGSDSRPEGALGAAQVALLFLTTFLPVIALYAAAQVRAISWPRANTMLIFSLLIPAARFSAAEREKRERS
ncbi:MAG TPA: hypothetical protein VFQ35_21595 [Polyangiaceae bacterium]|nr:hypothetical protein [Polyangiaceae bacterium]